MKNRLMLALTLCLAAALVPSAFAKPKPAPAPAAPVIKTHRIVFALTSGDEMDWKQTVGNIGHLFEGFGTEPVEVELVAYSKGLTFVTNTSSQAADIARLQAEHHVRFVACMNSMRALHVEAKDLLPGVTPVPSGIVEVVTKQEQGWSYIKAGK